MLQTDAAGTLVELAALPPSFAVEYTRDAVVPAGTQLMAAPEHSQRIMRPGWIPLGFDPNHPVGWRGDRMFFHWSYVGRSEVGFLSGSDHDYPCGPSKKLYGYADNDPIQILLVPTADACAARFEHDVMVTTAVPIARDAIREGRHEDATRIRASYPSRAVGTSDDVDVLAIPGTRNVLLVTARHVRVV